MKATLIEHMGDDIRVVNAARVSFDKESELVDEFGEDEFGKFKIEVLSQKDKKLIKYLASHGHWTPFSHPQITLRYDVPIFVARQEFKHIVGFTRNEVSRRYVDEEPRFYTPEVWRSRPEGSVKQGSSVLLNTSTKDWCSSEYKHLLAHCESVYGAMIAQGVAPEQARMVLPQSMYTSYYVTGSLAAFARFFNQRTHSTAQVEIQELAHMVGKIIQPLFPVSWEALTNDSK